jgi:hypothetical protein
MLPYCSICSLLNNSERSGGSPSEYFSERSLSQRWDFKRFKDSLIIEGPIFMNSCSFKEINCTRNGTGNPGMYNQIIFNPNYKYTGSDECYISL